jgi:hypothetical protein
MSSLMSGSAVCQRLKFSEIEKQARKRGVKVETLVNLWLQQKLVEQTAV